jgi:SNF2 family DNA or RNA helicase
VTGAGDKWNIPITIQLFTPRGQITATLTQLQRRVDIRQGPVLPFLALPPKVPFVNIPQPQYSSSPPQYTSSSQPSSSPPVVPAPILPNYNELIQRSEAFDPRTLRDAHEKFGLSIKDLEKLPLAKQPSQVKTPMLSYQLQGLAWLMKMEHPKLPSGNEVREFWTKKGVNWFNVATHLYISSPFTESDCSTTTQAPQFARGGILADDMGLGKTIQ